VLCNIILFSIKLFYDGHVIVAS